MKCIFCMLAILCGYLPIPAQTLNQPNTGLSIGQTMPGVLLTNLQNYPAKTVAFSAFQKELTIIDFWATWCGSCIGFFPKLQDLQNRFAGRLQLLMVNGSHGDDVKKVTAFLQRRKTNTGLGFELPFLLQDSLFSQLFPHETIPHCVWLAKDGKVIAITESSEVTEANIEAVLNGKDVALAFKNDLLLFDNEKDRLQADAPVPGTTPLFYSQLTEERPGAGSQVFYKETRAGEVNLLRIVNQSLLRLYQMSNPAVFKQGISRLVIDTAVAHLFPQRALPTVRYCYELQTRPGSRETLLRMLAADLEHYFLVKAVAQEEKMACYVLKPGKNFQQLFTANGRASTALDEASPQPHIRNGKVETLRSFLEGLVKKPVLDETGLKQPIDMIFPPGIFHFNAVQLKDFLNSKGLLMEESTRRIRIPRLIAITKQ